MGHNVYSSSTLSHVVSNHLQGIPVFANWAALLDPRTKWLTVCLLLEDERRLIWGDIKIAIMELVEGKAVDTVPTCADDDEVAPVQLSKNVKEQHHF